MVKAIIRDAQGTFITSLEVKETDGDPPPEVQLNGRRYVHSASVMPTGEAVYTPPKGGKRLSTRP